MNTTPATTAAAPSRSTAPKGRWAAWVAGLAVAMAMVTGCSSSAPDAPVAKGTDEVALNGRLDAIHDRADAMKDRIAAMKAKRERIDRFELPAAPAPTTKPPKVKPPKVTPDPVPEPGTGPISIDKNCINQPTGCLQHH